MEIMESGTGRYYQFFDAAPAYMDIYRSCSLCTLFFYCLFIVLKYVILGNDVPGYSSLIASITFLAGVQLIGIGILGEYIGRIYIETKHRPLYILKQDKKEEK